MSPVFASSAARAAGRMNAVERRIRRGPADLPLEAGDDLSAAEQRQGAGGDQRRGHRQDTPKLD